MLKSKHTQHYIRFSLALVRESSQNNKWEIEEKARLLELIKNTLELESEGFDEFIIHCNFIGPQELIALEDIGIVYVPVKLVHFLKCYNKGNIDEDFVTNFDTALDLGLFDLHDPETLIVVCLFV